MDLSALLGWMFESEQRIHVFILHDRSYGEKQKKWHCSLFDLIKACLHIYIKSLFFLCFSFLFLFPCILIMSIVWFSFRLLLSFDFSQFRSIFPFASFLSNTFKSSCVRFANWKCHIKWDMVHFNQPIFSSLSTFSLPWQTNLVTRCTAWLPSSLWSACGLSFTTY